MQRIVIESAPMCDPWLATTRNYDTIVVLNEIEIDDHDAKLKREWRKRAGQIGFSDKTMM